MSATGSGCQDCDDQEAQLDAIFADHRQRTKDDPSEGGEPEPVGQVTDRDALVGIIGGLRFPGAHAIAAAILSSEWLAEYVERIRAEVRERCAYDLGHIETTRA